MKTALIIGASRGIGRQIALTLAKNGFRVGVASKTTKHTDKLPGTIYSVCNEIEQSGGIAIPIKCDCRLEADIEGAVDQCLASFGQLDSVVYNAGAILWKPVKDTPLRRFDLMLDVNVRGAYCMVHKVLPHMLERQNGNILLVAPPIYSRFFKGKTPYSVTKVGMTILTMGLSNELQDTGVTISSLWPATTTESHVTNVMEVPHSMMRKPNLFADASLKILQETTNKYNGKALIDEDMLRELGITDFSQYRCASDQEPPRIMPKKFPSLTVEEEDNTIYHNSNSSKL